MYVVHVAHCFLMPGIQSPNQMELLAKHNPNRPVFVEGPFPLWLKKTCVYYYILRADPTPPEEKVSKFSIMYFISTLLMQILLLSATICEVNKYSTQFMLLLSEEQLMVSVSTDDPNLLLVVYRIEYTDFLKLDMITFRYWKLKVESMQWACFPVVTLWEFSPQEEEVYDPERCFYYPLQLDLDLDRDLGDEENFDVDDCKMAANFYQPGLTSLTVCNTCVFTFQWMKVQSSPCAWPAGETRSLWTSGSPASSRTTPS